MTDPAAEMFLRIADGPEATTKIKGSRFTGQALSAHSLEEARARLETIRKQYHDATHHCWAAVWGPPESSDERFDDDGEPSGSAGRPILHHLRGTSACDGLVVVTRWFGGTKLGTGGLVQAYSEAAHLALEAAGRIQIERRTPLSLRFDYGDLGAVEAILARREEWTRRVERNFDDGPAFAVDVRRDRADALRAELVEELGGRPVIEVGSEILAES
jgi:uncharacterized YigZ family protein